MAKNNKKESDKKWKISAWSAFLFLVISAPFVYGVTNEVTSKVGLQTSVEGCPTNAGLVLHAVVFLLLARAMMEVKLPGV